MMFGEEVLRVSLPELSESLFVCRRVGLTDSSDDKAVGSRGGNGGIQILLSNSREAMKLDNVESGSLFALDGRAVVPGIRLTPTEICFNYTVRARKRRSVWQK